MAPKNLIQDVCILMYHGVSLSGGHGTISVAVFERQIRLLTKYFSFIHTDDLRSGVKSAKRKILLTFDDGFHNNYEYAVPVLKRLNAPAIFFLNNRHCHRNKYLWFSYLRAMEGYFKQPGVWLRNSYFDLSPAQKAKNFQTLREFLLNLEPHPSELYQVLEHELPPLESFAPQESISEYFSGVSTEEIKQIADDPLFDIGLHTADHALLSRCSPDEI